MKPPPFALRRPASVPEALDILAREGDDARPLAGGQSLMPMLVMRLARPAVLVDLNRCAGLDQVALDGTLARIAIACVGAGPTALRLHAAEALLQGRRPTPEALRDAARAALATCRPPSDLAADAAHRRAVLEGLVPRAVAEALAARSLAA